MRDLHNHLALVHLADPTDLVYTDTLSKIADLQGFESAEFIVSVGAFTGVDGSNYLTITLQESDTTATGDFTTVAAEDIVGAYTVINSTAKDSTSQMVGYIGSKRYVRVKLDYTGTAISAGLVGVVAVLGRARHLPPTAPDPVTAT